MSGRKERKNEKPWEARTNLCLPLGWTLVPTCLWLEGTWLFQLRLTPVCDYECEVGLGLSVSSARNAEQVSRLPKNKTTAARLRRQPNPHVKMLMLKDCYAC